MIAKISSSPASPNDTIFINHASGQKTYIISLTFPSITLAIPHLPRMSYGTDIWELRADLLSSSTEPLGASNLPSLEYVKEQISLLQQHSDLPILFTIRTISQGGKFPDDEAQAALHMMFAAAEASCEYIDVEIEWPESLIEEVNQKKGNSKVVASFHDWTGGIRWSSEVLKEKYVLADTMGDIIKLSIFAADMYDAHELALFVRSHSLSPLAHKPLLAVGMGPHGQLSRATSPISIVTHSIMPPSAPGQLSLAQVHQTMHLIGQIPKRNFFIFGNNIAHSLSPALHNAGFAELGLPHSYSIHETESVDDSVQRMMGEPNFGGASVTFPHKLQVGKYLQGTSVVAGLIGAVNTVIVQTDPKTGGRVLWGDNTDWLGIKSCIEINWPLPGGVVTEATVVIGAGGAGRAACYAVQELGAQKVYLVNRTRSKSDALAADFPDLEFEHYASLSEFPASVSPPPNIVVGCVPADDFTEADIPTQLFSLSMDGGVLVEMAYRPLETALTKVSKRFDGWRCARGTDVLKEQAYHQFKMWTGRRAPAQIMETAMNAVINARQ